MCEFGSLTGGKTKRPQIGEAAEPIRLVEGEFQRVVLGADDVIVVTVPGRISDKQIAFITDQLKRVFEGRKVLILEGGAKIGAMAEP